MEHVKAFLRLVLAWIAVLASVLFVCPPAHATITNTGQVFVGSNLTIASTVDGSRTVDAQADGPFGTITVGNGFVGPPGTPVVPAPTGSLSLINGAAMTVTNDALGNRGFVRA